MRDEITVHLRRRYPQSIHTQAQQKHKTKRKKQNNKNMIQAHFLVLSHLFGVKREKNYVCHSPLL